MMADPTMLDAIEEVWTLPLQQAANMTGLSRNILQQHVPLIHHPNQKPRVSVADLRRFLETRKKTPAKARVIR